MGKPIKPEELRLYEEGDLGLYKKAESIKKHGTQFEPGVRFPPFEELDKNGIFDLAGATETHHPIFAYESAASRSTLQEMTHDLKRGKFFEYAAERECLNQVVQALRLE